MLKYVIKRILLLFFTLFIIVGICFILVRLLPIESMIPDGLKNEQREWYLERMELLGYNKPIVVQFWMYLRNIFTRWDFGTSWQIDKSYPPAWDLLTSRLLPTVLVNVYSLLFSVPVGILLGVYTAIKKNKWQDHVLSTATMIFVSIPSYVYAFLVQYLLFFKLDLFPATVYSLQDAGGSWVSAKMFYSMLPAVLSLSFGEIASLCRFTRAELTECLTADYMLLARTKGLTRAQATMRHALKNAMVPVLPMIIGSFIGILGGSLIIEQIFGIPGVGQLYLQSIQQFDYDVFMLDCIFYTSIGLFAGIVIDLSYGFIDPRIRMGEK